MCSTNENQIKCSASASLGVEIADPGCICFDSNTGTDKISRGNIMGNSKYKFLNSKPSFQNSVRNTWVRSQNEGCISMPSSRNRINSARQSRHSKKGNAVVISSYKRSDDDILSLNNRGCTGLQNTQNPDQGSHDDVATNTQELEQPVYIMLKSMKRLFMYYLLYALQGIFRVYY